MINDFHLQWEQDFLSEWLPCGPVTISSVLPWSLSSLYHPQSVPNSISPRCRWATLAVSHNSLSWKIIHVELVPSSLQNKPCFFPERNCLSLVGATNGILPRWTWTITLRISLYFPFYSLVVCDATGSKVCFEKSFLEGYNIKDPF